MKISFPVVFVLLLLRTSQTAASLETIQKIEAIASATALTLDVQSSRETGRRLQESEAELPITTIDASTAVITGDVVWSREETPIVHVVGKKRLFIEEGASLTITEGVTVRFASIKSGIRNNGLLRVLGSKENRVVMEPFSEEEGGDDFWQGLVFGKKAVTARYVGRLDGDQKFRDGSVLRNVDFVKVWSRDTAAVDALACLYFDEGKVPFFDGVRILQCEGIGVSVRAYNTGRVPILMRDVVISQPTDLRRGITFLDVKGPVVLRNLRIERKTRSKGGYGRTQKSHSDGPPALNLRNIGDVDIQDSVVSGGYMKWRDVKRARFTNNSVIGLPGTAVAVFEATRLATPLRDPSRVDDREIYIANNTFMGGSGVTFGREGGRVSFHNNTIRARSTENWFCRGLRVEGFVGPVNVTNNVFIGGERPTDKRKPSVPAVIRLEGTNVNFVDNVIRDCRAPSEGALFWLSGPRVGGEPTNSIIRSNLVKNVGTTGESTLLQVKSTNFIVTDNIFDEVDFRHLVDASGISSGSSGTNKNGDTLWEIPANYWGEQDIQDDLVSGQRSTVVDSLSDGLGVVVDFVTIKTRPKASSPLVKVPLPNEGRNIVRNVDDKLMLGGIVRGNTKLHLKNIDMGVVQSSIIVADNAVLTIGPNVELLFKRTTCILVEENGQLIVDGWRNGKPTVVLRAEMEDQGRFAVVRHLGDTLSTIQGAVIDGGAIEHEAKENGGLIVEKVAMQSSDPKGTPIGCIESSGLGEMPGQGFLRIRDSTFQRCGKAGVVATFLESVEIFDSTFSILGKPIDIATVTKSITVADSSIVSTKKKGASPSKTGLEIEIETERYPDVKPDVVIEDNDIRSPIGIVVAGCTASTQVTGNTVVTSGPTTDGIQVDSRPDCSEAVTADNIVTGGDSGA